MNKRVVGDILRLYSRIAPILKERIETFNGFLEGCSQNRLFKELCFCLFTPQSKAEACWAAVEQLDQSGLLWNGGKVEIAEAIRGVRFRFNKAGYLIAARDRFISGKESLRRYVNGRPEDVRLLLVNEIKGLGMKEASHFLRNIGVGLGLAILDRHILKNLAYCGVIEAVPSTLGKSLYLEVEGKMRGFAQDTGIPMPELDLLFWYRQTGKVFK